MTQQAARWRLPPQGEQGSDTSINLQEMSIPVTHPLPVLPAVPHLILRPSPVCRSPGTQNRKTFLSLEQEKPNNKYLYLPLSLTWSISMCHRRLPHSLNYPSFLIFSSSSISCFLPVSCFFSLLPSQFQPLSITIWYSYSDLYVRICKWSVPKCAGLCSNAELNDRIGKSLQLCHVNHPE